MVHNPKDAKKATPRLRKSAHKKVLVLSGGGYRGLFAAEFLQRLEASLGPGKSLSNHFDLVVCTSTGSIIGAGLITGRSCNEICAGYKELGSSIFPGKENWYCRPAGQVFRQLRRIFLGPPYKTSRLASALTLELGEDSEMKLSNIKTPIGVFTSVEYFQKTPILFSTDSKLSNVDDVTLLDAVLSSTAAPTYFAPVSVGDRTLIDGGIFANSPEIVAIQSAKIKWNCQPDDLVMLSVGTSAPSARTRPGRVRKAALDWLTPGRNDILGLLMATQEASARSLGKALLGNNYYCADGEPSPDESKELAKMDNCSETMEKILSSLADKEFNKFSCSEFRRSNI